MEDDSSNPVMSIMTGIGDIERRRRRGQGVGKPPDRLCREQPSETGVQAVAQQRTSGALCGSFALALSVSPCHAGHGSSPSAIWMPSRMSSSGTARLPHLPRTHQPVRTLHDPRRRQPPTDRRRVLQIRAALRAPPLAVFHPHPDWLPVVASPARGR